MVDELKPTDYEILMDEKDIVMDIGNYEEVTYSVICEVVDGEPSVGFTAFPDIAMSPEDALKFWLQLGKALKLAGKINKFEYE